MTEFSFLGEYAPEEWQNTSSNYKY